MIPAPPKFAHASPLLAVDPSINRPGGSVFVNSRLVAIAAPKPLEWPWPGETPQIGELARLAAAGVAKWYRELQARPCARCALDHAIGSHAYVAPAVVGEWPQIYRLGQSKGDPNDLPPLAAVVAAVAERVECPLGWLASPLPREWIGQLKKSKKAGEEWKSPRGRLIWGLLGEDERAVIAAAGKIDHDQVDGLGIGLWSLGRLRRTYVNHR